MTAFREPAEILEAGEITATAGRQSSSMTSAFILPEIDGDADSRILH